MTARLHERWRTPSSGAIGLTLGLYFASSTREPRAMRVLGTAALPIFGVTLLLTYSRSAIIVGGGEEPR